MISRVWQVLGVEVDFTIGTLEGVPMLKVSASGLVNSTGWSHPELGPWIYIDAPKDGILDLDFLAQGPNPGDIVAWPILPIEAFLLLPIPGWVTGVRVHASTNKVEESFRRAGSEAADGVRSSGQGMPLPWPFPWYTPKTFKLS